MRSLVCSNSKRLTLDEFKLISGSELAARMVTNRLEINNNAISMNGFTTWQSAFYFFIDEIRKWLEDNTGYQYYLSHTIHSNSSENIKIYFASESDMLHFKLKFDGWTAKK